MSDDKQVGATTTRSVVVENIDGHKASLHATKLTKMHISFIVKKPCACLWICLLIDIFMVMLIPSLGFKFAEQGAYDWVITDSPESTAQDSIGDARAQVKPLNKADVTQERSKDVPSENLQFMYYNKDDSDDDIFTPENVRDICKSEAVCTKNDAWKDYCKLTKVNGTDVCAANVLSVTYIFYPPRPNPLLGPEAQGLQGHNFECELLTEAQVKATREFLYKALDNELTAVVAGIFLSKDTKDHNPRKSSATRSIYYLAGPLDGYDGLGDKANEQQAKYRTGYWEKVEGPLWDHYGLTNTEQRSAYMDQPTYNDLRVTYYSWGLHTLEWQRLQDNDNFFITFSILFVFLWLCLHTGSLFLGAMAMLQIVLSIPMAIFIYTIFVPFFGFVNLFVIFLVLGIGADDVFVFVDAWKQSATDAPVGNTPDQILYNRLLFCFVRTVQAVFNTSFTTTVAFVATAISPIIPMSAFGIYAAMAIIINYLEVLTLTPAFVVIHHLVFADKSTPNCLGACVTCQCCLVCKRCNAELSPEATSVEAVKKDEEVVAEAAKEKKLWGADALMMKVYMPLMNIKVGPGIRPVPVLCIMIMVAAAIQGIYHASLLTTPNKTEEWQLPGHLFNGVQDEASNNFLGGTDSELVPMVMFWGVPGIDRSKMHRWKPNEERGEAEFDDKFDLTKSAAQQHILKTCADLRVWECKEKGCDFNKLMQPGSLDCFLEEFYRWYNAPSTAPLGKLTGGGGDGTYTIQTCKDNKVCLEGSEFLTKIEDFRGSTRVGHFADPPKPNSYNTWKESIGFIGSELKFVTIDFALTTKFNQPQTINIPVMANLDDFVDKINGDAPDTCKGLTWASFGLVWTATQRQLVEGLFIGFAICFPMVFLVLLFATGNIILTVFATINIACICGTVLGFFKTGMGWDLGIAESIAGIIVIGFSVDYIVHFAHMYMEADHVAIKKRAERADFTISRMGTTVFAGAVTTFGSGVFMFACQQLFFVKMAVMITMTIFLSFCYSLGLFMCILYIMGPEDDQGNVTKCVKKKA